MSVYELSGGYCGSLPAWQDGSGLFVGSDTRMHDLTDLAASSGACQNARPVSPRSSAQTSQCPRSALSRSPPRLSVMIHCETEGVAGSKVYPQHKNHDPYTGRKLGGVAEGLFLITFHQLC